MEIKKILIANRSEIASRIIFTCKSLNIKTIAIFCKEDLSLPFIYQADENYQLKGRGRDAYLEQKEILFIAKKLKANAIHPGYGLLSENYQFAQKIINAGLVWIGPTPKIIKTMGNKINAKKIMAKNNIPMIPSSLISKNEQVKNIIKKVNIIGYPLILKDPLGGGGKGIKKIFNSNELMPAFNLIKSKNSRLIKADQILIEKYIQEARHIEVQIAGDGNKFIHIFERECSIQRRHQKIIEETPCHFIKKKLLKKIYQTAIKIAKIIKYNNIGTIEFLVTQNNFYFLEMNTRLQVEHSVTEQTTGIDLVELQIELARKQKLTLNQKDLEQKNHSIECRIYSEDTENDFLPCIGKINNLIIPNAPYTRIDHNLEKNLYIDIFFDPMLAKITTCGKDRDKAIRNMINYLKSLNIEGIKTNINFLKRILSSKLFLSGNIHTQSIEKNLFIKIKKEQQEQNIEREIALVIASDIAIRKNSIVKNKANKWRMQQWQ